MNIDERLDRLTERHEALTQGIELMMLDTRENTKNIATLSLVVHEIAKSVQETKSSTEALKSSIETLGRIAEIHEQRLDELEG